MKPTITIQDLNNAIDKNGGAPCSSNPEIFYPEEIIEWIDKKLAIVNAKEMCAQCPLKIMCATYALENREPYGIWGGLLPEER